MKRKAWWKHPTSWITAWAMAVVTYILFKQPQGAWVSSVVMMCSAVVLAYVTGHQFVNTKYGPEIEDEPKNFGNQ